MRCLLCAAVVKQALQAALILRVGVVGAPIAQTAMYAVAVALAALAYRTETGRAFIDLTTIAKTALAGVIMVAAEAAVSLADLGTWAKLATAAATGIAAYGGVLALVGAVDLGALSRENITDEEQRKAHCRRARHIDDRG